MPYSLPELPYSYDALEPYIDAKTMEIHHTKHHQTYIDKVNTALEGAGDLASNPIEELISNRSDVPENIRTAVRNNGGGHANHSLFWTIMAPANEGGGGKPGDAVGDALQSSFGSFDQFKTEFTEAGKNRFGSGWVWLVVRNGELAIGSTANQDSPVMGEEIAGLSGTPILGLDVWEHAYYIKHSWNRAEYIQDWWNVVNWKEVGRRYNDATKK